MSLAVIDLSSNNQRPFNFVQAKKAGVAGAFVKLTQSNDYVNPDAAADIAAARAAGLLVAGYHFVDPAVSVGSQVDWIKQHLFGVKCVAIDSEMTDAGWPQITECTRLLCAAVAQELKVQVFLYSNPSFLGQMPGSPWGHSLWLADYGVSNPGRPYSLWQHTDSGIVPGIPGKVDVSIFNGSLSQLASLFGTPMTVSQKFSIALSTIIKSPVAVIRKLGKNKPVIVDHPGGGEAVVYQNRGIWQGIPDPTELSRLESVGVKKGSVPASFWVKAHQEPW